MVEDEKNTSEEVDDEVGVDETEEPEGSKISDAEMIKKLKAEAKSYRQSKATLKKEFEETKAKLEALEAEKLTDAEKKEKKIAELEKRLVDIQTETKEKEIDNLILTAAAGRNFVDIKVVQTLIKDELQGVEEVDEKVINKVIDTLAKEKPFLISSGASPSKGNFEKTDKEPKKDADKLMSEFLHG